MFTYLRDLLGCGFARFNILDISISMDIYTLLLALGLILLILALLSCFLLTGRERSFEEVTRDNPAYSLLLADKGVVSGGKTGKKDKKKKVKDGPVASSVENKARHSGLTKEDSQHSQSLTHDESLAESHSIELVTTSAASKGRKSIKKISGGEHQSVSSRHFIASTSSKVGGPAVETVDDDESGVAYSEDTHLAESVSVESSIFNSGQSDSAGSVSRKRNKKAKKGGSEEEYAGSLRLEGSATGSSRISAHLDQTDGPGSTLHHQQHAGSLEGGAISLGGKKSGKSRGADSQKGGFTAVREHKGAESSLEGRAGYSSESQGAESDKGEHIVPEEPKPSSEMEAGVHGLDSPGSKMRIGKDGRDLAMYSSGKGDLGFLLEQLRLLDLNEAELKQIVHVLTEKNTLTTVWIKAGLKPDPRISELEKLLLDKDQKSFNDQAVLSNANEKLKHMQMELSAKDNSHRQLEHNYKLAVQQNQQKDSMLQETNARLIQLQKTMQSQSPINPQTFKQLQEENKSLKDQFARLQNDNLRCQSDLKVRDSQVMQCNQELKRVQELCAGLEQREKQLNHTISELKEKSTGGDLHYSELKSAYDQSVSNSNKLKSQLESERAASQSQIDQLNRRIEASASVTTVQNVSSAPASNTAELEEKIRKLEQELQKLRSANASLQSDADEANSAKANLEARCQQLTNDLQQNDSISQELKKQLQSMEENSTHFSKADAENTRLRDELSRLKTDLDTRDTRIRDLTAQIDSESRSQMSELAAYRRDLETWEREKAESAARFSDLEKRLENREKEHVDEVQQVKQQLVQVEEEKARLMDKEVSTDELRYKEFENVRNAKNSLEALVSELQAKLTEVNQKLVEQTTEVTLIRTQMDDSLKRNVSLEVELREAVLGRRAAEAEKENLQMEVLSKADLDAQLTRLRESLAASDGERSSLQRKMSILEQTMVGRDNSVTKLEDQIRDLQSENAKLKDSAKDQQQHLSNGTSSSEVVTLSQTGAVQAGAPGESTGTPGNEGSSSSLNSKLTAAEAEIQTLKQQLSAAGISTSVLQEMEHLRSRTVKLESQLSEYKTMYAKMTFGLTEEEINHYKASFDLFDKDGDGCITTSEIREAIKACGLKPSAQWVKDLIAEADADGSGTIEWPEFLKAMTGLTEQIKREEQVTVARSETVSSSFSHNINGTVSESHTQTSKDSVNHWEAQLKEAYEKIEKLSEELERQRQLASKVESSSELRQQLEMLTKANSRLESKLSEYRTLYAQTTYGLSEEEISRYKQAFDLFDKDGDGCITKTEIEEAIVACGLKPTSSWVQDLVREADEDGSSTIEWPEFLKAMTGITQEARKSGHGTIETTVTVTRLSDSKSVPSSSSDMSQLIAEWTSKVDAKQVEIDKLRSDLKQQQDKNNELRQKNYKAVDAANQVEKIAQEVAKKTTKELEEKYRLEMEEQRKLTQALLTAAFPNVQVPSKTETYREWLHEFEKVVHREMLTQQTHTETTVVTSPRSPSHDAALHAKVDSLQRSNHTLESQLEHYKAVLGQTDSMLKALETSARVDTEQWQTKVTRLEAEVDKLRRDRVSQMSDSHSSSAEVQRIHTEVTILRERFEKEETERIILQKEVHRLNNELQSERQTGQDLSVQAVKLRGMVKTGQGALKQEQEHVTLLQRQLKEVQNGTVTDDLAEIRARLAETQQLLEKELMNNKLLGSKLTSLGVTITTDS